MIEQRISTFVPRRFSHLRIGIERPSRVRPSVSDDCHGLRSTNEPFWTTSDTNPWSPWSSPPRPETPGETLDLIASVTANDLIILAIFHPNSNPTSTTSKSKTPDAQRKQHQVHFWSVAKSTVFQVDQSGCHSFKARAKIPCIGNSHPDLAQAIADRYDIHFISKPVLICSRLPTTCSKTSTGHTMSHCHSLCQICSGQYGCDPYCVFYPQVFEWRNLRADPRVCS